MDAYLILTAVFVTAFGLVFGSFANVVIWRYPRSESLAFPGSHCPVCDTPIAWYDNVPLVGWLALRGKCRSCGVAISARYPVVEALSGLLWLTAWLEFGLSWRTLVAVAFFYLLLILAFIDIDTMRLPNLLVAILAAIGLVGVVTSQFFHRPAAPLLDGVGFLSPPMLFALAGLAAGGVFPLAVSALYAAVRKTPGLGMGDVKLAATIGVFLGPYTLMALFFGSAVGAVYGLATQRGEGVRRKIPFGPFLAIGAVLTTVVGLRVWGWYLGLLGL